MNTVGSFLDPQHSRHSDCSPQAAQSSQRGLRDSTVPTFCVCLRCGPCGSGGGLASSRTSAASASALERSGPHLWTPCPLPPPGLHGGLLALLPRAGDGARGDRGSVITASRCHHEFPDGAVMGQDIEEGCGLTGQSLWLTEGVCDLGLPGRAVGTYRRAGKAGADCIRCVEGERG